MNLPIGELFDVAVIGGGIQGAGVAREAVAAGYRTLLIERDEWAAATSRWSSKLIHGGLRYLESGQIDLVYHSLKERQRLLREQPTLVKPVKFFIPIYRHTRRRAWQIRAGLSLYALLTGLHPQARFRSIARAHWDELGGLRTDALQHVFQYWDGQTDDAALTRAVVDLAKKNGAYCLQHSELVAAHLQDDHQFSLDIKTADVNWQCRARNIVNSTGPWVNELLKRCTPTPEQRPISWVKGSHILVPTMNLPGIFYLEAPRDGRAVFVMPWQGKTLIGTTEVEIDTPQAAPTNDEIKYLLETALAYFPTMKTKILDSFAGVRVLPVSADSPFSRARESVLTKYSENGAALISIYGGKLTTYRHSALQVLKLLRTDK
ncbi:MAG: glycerol-3-phosphate dehydrogenase [Verrucomicrobiaceae bacterium]|nr:glycerol-3-phosphate dehydrogenase [Verrucomicrobiaceae bacterium]